MPEQLNLCTINFIVLQASIFPVSKLSGQNQRKANRVRMELSITQPDDWHLHLRDGDLLEAVVSHRFFFFNINLAESIAETNSDSDIVYLSPSLLCWMLFYALILTNLCI